MPSSIVTMTLIKDILDKAKKCDFHVQKYEDCILDKNNTFEYCYIIHMNQFHSCVKKLNLK